MSNPVRLEIEGPVAWITLNRPERGNAVDSALASALLAAAIACDTDASIRCVVLTGAGRLFCAGGDVTAFAAAGEGVAALIASITADVNAAILHLTGMSKPLITAVNGPAAGAGLGLAILGDVALAGTSAHFTSGYSALGLSPDAGATWLLPRLIGLRRAQDMAITNRRVGAEEAAAIGLVTRIVADDALAAETRALAARLAQSATGALGTIRAQLYAGASASLEAQIEREARAIRDLSGSPHGREGIQAFAQKRAAAFG